MLNFDQSDILAKFDVDEIFGSVSVGECAHVDSGRSRWQQRVLAIGHAQWAGVRVLAAVTEEAKMAKAVKCKLL